MISTANRGLAFLTFTGLVLTSLLTGCAGSEPRTEISLELLESHSNGETFPIEGSLVTVGASIFDPDHVNSIECAYNIAEAGITPTTNYPELCESGSRVNFYNGGDKSLQIQQYSTWPEFITKTIPPQDTQVVSPNSVPVGGITFLP